MCALMCVIHQPVLFASLSFTRNVSRQEEEEEKEGEEDGSITMNERARTRIRMCQWYLSTTYGVCFYEMWPVSSQPCHMSELQKNVSTIVRLLVVLSTFFLSLPFFSFLLLYLASLWSQQEPGCISEHHPSVIASCFVNFRQTGFFTFLACIFEMENRRGEKRREKAASSASCQRCGWFCVSCKQIDCHTRRWLISRRCRQTSYPFIHVHSQPGSQCI